MTNWLERSVPWRVSPLLLERITLFLLIGLSVFLGGSRALGNWEACLMLFFLPLIAWVVYRLEMGTSKARQGASLVFFIGMTLLAGSSVFSLANLGSGKTWDPFPVLVTLQLLVSAMLFERRSTSLVFETTIVAILLLLATMEITFGFYLLAAFALTNFFFYLKFSFVMNQWIPTLDKEKCPWSGMVPSVSYRQLVSVVSEGFLVVVLGLGIGFLMTSLEWKMKIPESWRQLIQENFQVDIKGFGTGLSEERAEEIEFIPMEKPVEEEKTQIQEANPPEPTESVTEPQVLPQVHEEVIPPSIRWQKMLWILAMILLAGLLLTLLTLWFYFWVYRIRTRQLWRRLRKGNPREFLKTWLGYLRYLLTKYHIQPNLFLSSAEYLDQVVDLLKIQMEETQRAKIKQTLLRAWYSSSGVIEQELDLIGKVHQVISQILKKRGSWRQRLQFHFLAIPW